MELNSKFSYRDIEGWFNLSKFYNHLIRETPKNETIVEIGTALGKSTAYLASRSKLAAKTHLIIAVNDFAPSDFRKFLENMTKIGIADNVVAYSLDPEIVSHNIKNNSIYSVFVKTCPNYEQTIKTWFSKVKPGGILAGTGLIYDEVAQAVKNASKQFGVKEEIWQDDDGIWPCWKFRKV